MKKYAIAITTELTEVLRLESETEFRMSSLMKNYFVETVRAICRRQWSLAYTSIVLTRAAWDAPEKFCRFSGTRKYDTDELTVANLKSAVAYSRRFAVSQVD
jgi:hypothetical protein